MSTVKAFPKTSRCCSSIVGQSAVGIKTYCVVGKIVKFPSADVTEMSLSRRAQCVTVCHSVSQCVTVSLRCPRQCHCITACGVHRKLRKARAKKQKQSWSPRHRKKQTRLWLIFYDRPTTKGHWELRPYLKHGIKKHQNSTGLKTLGCGQCRQVWNLHDFEWFWVASEAPLRIRATQHLPPRWKKTRHIWHTIHMYSPSQVVLRDVSVSHSNYLFWSWYSHPFNCSSIFQLGQELKAAQPEPKRRRFKQARIRDTA